MKKISQFLTAFFMGITVLTIAGCASTSQQEGTGEYIDDSVITTKVKAAILNDQGLKVLDINVETFKGIVQLSGFVNIPAQATIAANLARSVSGVKSVKNDIRIK
jgi:hyperosmotically inducible protein